MVTINSLLLLDNTVWSGECSAGRNNVWLVRWYRFIYVYVLAGNNQLSSSRSIEPITPGPQIRFSRPLRVGRRLCVPKCGVNGDTLASKCELYKTPICSEHRLVLNSFFASLDHLSRRCRLKRVALIIGIESHHHEHLFAPRVCHLEQHQTELRLINEVHFDTINWQSPEGMRWRCRRREDEVEMSKGEDEVRGRGGGAEGWGCGERMRWRCGRVRWRCRRLMGSEKQYQLVWPLRSDLPQNNTM